MACIPISFPPFNSSSSTGFLDLPAEVRNQIYEYALVYHERPIALFHDAWCKWFSPKKPNDHLERQWGCVCKSSTGKGRQSQHPCITRHITANLVRVSRKIYDEALPLLYGRNTFRPPRCRSDDQGLKGMGLPLQLIRHVDLDKPDDRKHGQLRTDIKHLRPLRNLQSIIMTEQSHICCPQVLQQPDRMARNLYALFKQLRRYRRRDGREADAQSISQIIKFTAPTSRTPCNWHDHDSGMEGPRNHRRTTTHIAPFQAEVRAILHHELWTGTWKMRAADCWISLHDSISQVSQLVVVRSASDPLVNGDHRRGHRQEARAIEVGPLGSTDMVHAHKEAIESMIQTLRERRSRSFQGVFIFKVVEQSIEKSAPAVIHRRWNCSI